MSECPYSNLMNPTKLPMDMKILTLRFRLGQWILPSISTTNRPPHPGINLGSADSRREASKKAHLVDLKLDKCPDTFLCYSTAQMPAIPTNLYMVMLVPRKNLKHSLPPMRLPILA